MVFFWHNPTFKLVMELIIQIIFFILISILIYKILPTRVYYNPETGGDFFNNVKNKIKNKSGNIFNNIKNKF